jgi:hypothetical protein
MRTIGLCGLVAAAMLMGTPPASAQNAPNAPWCAYYDRDTANCGFFTFEQCLQTISGIGGWCQPNPWYVPERRPRGRTR